MSAQQHARRLAGRDHAAAARCRRPSRRAELALPNTTVVPRSRHRAEAGRRGGRRARSSLVALLTEDGQSIEQGLVWRVFRDKPGADGKPRLVSTHREPSPTLRLDAGDYIVNVALRPRAT